MVAYRVTPEVEGLEYQKHNGNADSGQRWATISQESLTQRAEAIASTRLRRVKQDHGGRMNRSNGQNDPYDAV